MVRVYEQIERSLNGDHLPHAILLESLPGWGVIELAEKVSGLILEEEVDFSMDRNIDLLQVEVEEKKRFISIDQVRDAIEFLLNTSMQGSRKLVVMKFVERLSIPASQALLKVLEEPPVDKHLLLVTCNSAMLMPTIRSRCQRFVVKPGTQSEVQSFISESELDSDASSKYLSDYGGAPYAMSEAIGEERVCVRDVLADLTRRKISVIDASNLLRKFGDIDGLLRSWQYIAHRFAENSNRVQPVAVFYDQLSDVRRQFLEVPGLDADRQLQRLCIKWQQLYAPARPGAH